MIGRGIRLGGTGLEGIWEARLRYLKLETSHTSALGRAIAWTTLFRTS